MRIIPTLREIGADIQNVSADRGTKSFRFDFEAGDFAVKDSKVETVTEKEKLKVWIDKLIRTELDRFPAYEGTSYGVAFPWNVVGVRDRDYIRIEITAELRKKLLENDEITDVRTLTVEFTHRRIFVTVTLVTVWDEEDIKFEYYY